MTTMNKFRVLVWTFIIVVLLVAGGAYRMSSEANKKLERIFQVEIPFKDLVSEMEIMREQSIASVLAYSRTREQKDRRFAEQSTAELERKMDSLWRKAPTEALREACGRAAGVYHRFKALSSEILEVENDSFAKERLDGLLAELNENHHALSALMTIQIVPAIQARILAEDYKARTLNEWIFGLNLALASIAMLFTALMSWSLNKDIMAPLQTLIKGADRIGDGALDYRIELTANGQLGKLAQAINQLARKRKTVEDKLQKAKLDAEAAGSRKTQFLANVSHEIRTPMNSIIGFSEIILDSKCLEDVHRHAKSILTVSESLMMLVKPLLDHAKIESGKLEIENRALDLRLLVERIVSSARIRATRSGFDVRMSMAETVPRYVMGDLLRLNQVLSNLVNNAIKFTERGSVTILVEKLDSGNRGVTYRISVTDTGIGIPKECQKTIFNSFVQADGSTTRKYGGTGLGTTIAMQLVKLMGGEMGLESTPGKGSTFWFTVTLDTCSEEQVDKLSIALREQLPDGNPKHRPAGYILLVEDYPPNQEIARLHLESAGHRVELAKNGVEALEATEKTRYDLILMDLQMPELDGYDAARCIRSGDSPSANVPIAAMTANADKETRKRCLAMGMTTVITKPIQRLFFLQKVDSLLESGESGFSERGAGPPEGFGADTSTVKDNVPMDWDRAVEEFGGDNELFSKVFHQFIFELERQINFMGDAVKNHDSLAVAKETHKIKGAAGILTINSLTDAVKRLETHAKEDNHEKQIIALRELEQEFRNIQAYIPSLQSSSVKHLNMGI